MINGLVAHVELEHEIVKYKQCSVHEMAQRKVEWCSVHKNGVELREMA